MLDGCFLSVGSDDWLFSTDSIGVVVLYRFYRSGCFCQLDRLSVPFRPDRIVVKLGENQRVFIRCEGDQ